MYAIVQTGGKQIRVSEGQVVKVEKLEGESGADITLDKVLLVGGEDGAKIGSPYIDGASVSAQIIEQKKDKKVIVFKKKRRHNYRRKKGHRQQVSILRITGINA